MMIYVILCYIKGSKEEKLSVIEFSKFKIWNDGNFEICSMDEEQGQVLYCEQIKIYL